MIHYNMRYRGPLEYDKFVLNVFQFHNEIHELYITEFKKEYLGNDKDTYKTLADYINAIDTEYENHVGNEAKGVVGFSEKIYLMLINYKER